MSSTWILLQLFLTGEGPKSLMSQGLHNCSKILTQPSPRATNCLPQAYGDVFCLSLYKVGAGQKRFPLLLNGISVIVFFFFFPKLKQNNFYSGVWLMQCNLSDLWDIARGAGAAVAALGCAAADCDLHCCPCGSETSNNSHQRLMSQRTWSHMTL